MSTCLPGLEDCARTASEPGHQFFCTPDSATDAILPHIFPRGWHGQRVIELGAGDGHILRRLRAYGVPREAITAVELRGVCEERLRPLAGDVIIGDALGWAPVLEPADVVICNPPYGAMLAWAEACLACRNAGGECWMLTIEGFMFGSGRVGFHRQHTPDVYALTWRPDFTGGGANPRNHIWTRFPGYGQWQPLERAAGTGR